MSHTIAKAFEIMSERLEVTPLQLSTVSKRHERVRNALHFVAVFRGVPLDSLKEREECLRIAIAMKAV